MYWHARSYGVFEFAADRNQLARWLAIVNISAKTEYACIAVLELALQYESGEPVRIRQIADAHGIPSRFLVQILLQLKGAGLVTSTRGASGGYQLLKTPREITLAEVMGVIDGRACEVSSSASKETPVSKTLLRVWNGVSQAQHEQLSSVTFEDLVVNLSKQSENMYFI